MKTFLSTLGNAILWFLIAVLLFLVTSGVYQHFFNNDNYKGFFGVGYAVVVSGSMEPNIHISDMIIYKDHPADQYDVGDVIVYVRERENAPEMLITHRIIELWEDTVITKGDANTIADDPVSCDKIVGRIVWRIPKVGVVVNFVKTPAGSVATIGAVVLIIIFNLIASRSRARRHQVNTAQGTQVIKY